MSEITKIVYIDDMIDTLLSKYLDNLTSELTTEDIKTEYEEVQFAEPIQNYKDLLDNSRVNSADIILIDSKLFENETVEQKFTGEEFKMIYTKIHPYSEVIVISQNKGLEQFGTIAKYKSFSEPKEDQKNAKNFYDVGLKCLLQGSIKSIQEKRAIVEKVFSNNKESYGEDLIVDKIKNTMMKVPL